jgi:hypothetical protein
MNWAELARLGMTASKSVRNVCVSFYSFWFGGLRTIGKPFGMLTRVCGTSQRLRTNGKPLESALLGSLFIVHGMSLACQVWKWSEAYDSER